MIAVETIFGLLERGFDWGIWDVSFSHANLGITQIFLYFLALLGVSRESGNHTNLLLVSLGEIGGIGVRFTWGSRESGNHANLLLVSFREIGVRFTWGLLIRQHSVSEMLRI